MTHLPLHLSNVLFHPALQAILIPAFFAFFACGLGMLTFHYVCSRFPETASHKTIIAYQNLTKDFK